MFILLIVMKWNMIPVQSKSEYIYNNCCKEIINKIMDPTPTKNNLPRKGEVTTLAEALDYAGYRKNIR